jgi:hypothetical protein
MAWHEIEKAVPVQPLEVEGAVEICRELSRTPKPDLQPEHYYARGGLLSDGIQERVRREVTERFPNAVLPDIIESPGDPSKTAMGYACLDVSLRFDAFFRHSREPMPFRDRHGQHTDVHAFGIPEENKEGERHTREQVLVLFRDKGQFAVDLSAGSQPYQIIVARIERGPTLRAMLDTVEARIAQSEPRHLNEVAVLLVPTMNWRLHHRFHELEKPIINLQFGVVVEALQSLQFKMDRKGARVISSAHLPVDWNNGHPEETDPDRYVFDRPFLIVMKQRGSAQPFLVMWIEHAELMQPRR